MKFIKNLLTHVGIAMLMGMVVLVIMDNHNPMLKFLTSSASKTYIIVMCVVCLLALISYAARLYKE